MRSWLMLRRVSRTMSILVAIQFPERFRRVSIERQGKPTIKEIVYGPEKIRCLAIQRMHSSVLLLKTTCAV